MSKKHRSQSEKDKMAHDKWVKDQKRLANEGPKAPPNPLILIEGEEPTLTDAQLRGLIDDVIDTEHMRFYLRKQQNAISTVRRAFIKIANDAETPVKDKISALREALKATEQEDKLIIHETMSIDARNRKIDESGINGLRGHIQLTVAATYIDEQGNIQLLTPPVTGSGDQDNDSGLSQENEKEGDDS